MHIFKLFGNTCDDFSVFCYFFIFLNAKIIQLLFLDLLKGISCGVNGGLPLDELDDGEEYDATDDISLTHWSHYELLFKERIFSASYCAYPWPIDHIGCARRESRV